MALESMLSEVGPNALMQGAAKSSGMGAKLMQLIKMNPKLAAALGIGAAGAGAMGMMGGDEEEDMGDEGQAEMQDAAAMKKKRPYMG